MPRLPRLPRFRLRALVLGALLVLLVTACGGGGGGSGPVSLPSRTGSLVPSRTGTGLPTRDVTTPTRPPTTRPTAPPTTRPTAPPTTPPTAPTSAPTTPSTPPTGTPSSPSAAPEPAPGDQEQQDSGDTSAWWWLALVVALVAAVVAFLLVRRSRRRRAWAAELAAAESEVGWFARDLVPQLRGSGSVAGVAGGWAVAVPRVTALDDRLTGLVTSAPGEQETARATAVQGAVRTARDRIAAVVATGGSDAWALDLDAAQAPLLAVLVPPARANEQGPGPPPAQ